MMTALHNREDFEAAKPAISLLLQRHPEMLKTREINGDNTGVDPSRCSTAVGGCRKERGLGGRVRRVPVHFWRSRPR